MKTSQILFKLILLGAVPLVCFVGAAFAQCEKKKTQENLTQGNNFFNKNDFRAALDSFDKALKFQPECALAAFNKGRAMRKLNRFEDAIASLENALKLNYADKFAVHLALAETQLGRGKNFSKEALASAEQAVSLNSNSVEAWSLIAAANANLGQTENELSALTQILKLTPENTAARRAKGTNHLKLQQYKEAAEEFAKLTEVEPQNAQNHLVLSEIYQIGGQIPEAIAAAQKALQLQPGLAPASYLLGNIYLRLKQYGKAIEFNSQALNSKTEYQAETNYNLGLALLAAGRDAEAVEAFQRALIYPTKFYEKAVFNNYIYKAMSSGYGQLGKYDQAIKYLQQAKDINDRDADADVDLSWWLSLLGENEAAATAAGSAIEKAPQDATGYVNRCRAYISLGKPNEAIADCQQAMQLAPNDGETLFYYGRALREKKQIKDADGINKKAIASLEKEMSVRADQREVAATSVAGIKPAADGLPAGKDDAGKLLTIRYVSPYKPYILGNAYFDDRQYPKAVASYKLSLQRAPQFPLARFNLGIVYFVQKNKPAAVEQYDELQKIDAKRAEELKKIIDGK